MGLYWMQLSNLNDAFHLAMMHVHEKTSVSRVAYLTSIQFAKTGDPNGNGTSSDPIWTPYGSTSQGSVAIFNLTEQGKVNITMASGVRSAFCEFWAFNDVPEVSSAKH
jgi:hypothetical protein